MSQSTLQEIVDELAATVQNVIDASEYEVAVNAGMLFNPTTTAIDIYPNDPFRDRATASVGGHGGGYRFVVRARTGLNDLDSGQSILLDLMDDFSDVCVTAALEDDPTLNGRAQDVVVADESPSGFRPFRDLGGEGTMAGVVWDVLVLAAHS